MSRAVRVIDTISRTHPKAPVLITGDVTDSGDPDQMACARALLNTLANTNPILAVPGNHDYAWKGLLWIEDCWQRWVDTLGSPFGWGKPETRWLTDQCAPYIDGLGVWEDPDGEHVYLGVDSGDPTDKVHSAKGFVSQKLADGLRQALESHQGKCRIVMLHHHLFDEGRFMKLVGTEHFLGAVDGNCELVLFGHDHHLGLWRKRNGVPLMVASHKTTAEVFEHHLMLNVIEISRTEEGDFDFRHRLELT